jgi:hypothetical protein
LATGQNKKKKQIWWRRGGKNSPGGKELLRLVIDNGPFLITTYLIRAFVPLSVNNSARNTKIFSTPEITKYTVSELIQVFVRPILLPWMGKMIVPTVRVEFWYNNISQRSTIPFYHLVVRHWIYSGAGKQAGEFVIREVGPYCLVFIARILALLRKQTIHSVFFSDEKLPFSWMPT